MPTEREVEIERLRALLERVRAATGPDQSLDEAVHDRLFPADPWWLAIREGRRLVSEGRPSEYVYIAGVGNKLRADTWAETSRVPAYTASIGAALALVKRVLPEHGYSVQRATPSAKPVATLFAPPERPEAPIDDRRSWSQHIQGTGPSDEVAILAALLTAKLALAQAPGTDHG